MDKTIIHHTHYKAGSQWISEVLRLATLGSVNFFRLDPNSLLNQTIQANSLYAPVYLDKNLFHIWTGQRDLEEFSGEEYFVYKNRRRINFEVCKKNKAILQEKNFDLLRFFVVRDLRDSTISAYFSVKYSHVEDPHVDTGRKILQQMSEEEGINHTITVIVREYARIQRTWMNDPGIKVFRYEDFIKNEMESFRVVIDHCKIQIADARLSEIIQRNSFENLTGRKPGDENLNEHLRSGTQGNWKKYFSPNNIKLFKELYGATLIQTGYEKDLNW
jgi:lipopolysaccharide transport system ATP-binding protein